MPLECVLGETCVINAYPDVDASDAVSDYRCGTKSDNGTTGTDFALLDFEQMEQGVRVVAAADGRVEVTRNTLPDQPYVPGTDLQGQDCGNAVRINHANGYQTIYCHMKLGSVRVSPGQRVLAGQLLGEVGLSGRTNYPHLQLKITQGSDVIDPFAPTQNNACGEPFENLWIDAPVYTDAGLFAAAVSDSVPDLEEVQSGAARRAILAPSDSMVLYGHAFHANAGDKIDLIMTGPDGPVFEHQAQLTADQTELFRAFGRRAPSTGWPSGVYRGYVTLTRGDTILAVRHTDVTVD
ncbi:peptidoglycan DD-metalloendopeptidase family protein [Marivita sp. S0852]|uniref:M23 family metallopeptidase n=1 Tax=Marivita sp. S0852 TaxID=3373893 RepID=UPI003982D17D